MNGTSMASPQAAGAAALLISAAKQAGAQKQAGAAPAGDELVGAPARCRPPRQSIAQGNGLINVGAAWDLLKTNIKHG